MTSQMQFKMPNVQQMLKATAKQFPK